MLKKPVLLNLNQHGDLHLLSPMQYHFAAAEMTVPVVYSEVADIAREYPLVFLKDKAIPTALLGYEQNVNVYVSATGKWLAQYMPGKIRSYPFALVTNPDNPKQFGVAVDIESPFVGTSEGAPLFSQGKPTHTLSGYMKLLEQMQRATPVTREMVKVIRDAELLIDRPIRVKRKDQEDYQLSGIQVIDEKKLNQMPHDAFNRLRDSGVLPLIYAHLLSMANLRRGPLSGYMPGFEDDNHIDLDRFFDKDDDIFKF